MEGKIDRGATVLPLPLPVVPVPLLMKDEPKVLVIPAAGVAGIVIEELILGALAVEVAGKTVPKLLLWLPLCFSLALVGAPTGAPRGAPRDELIGPPISGQKGEPDDISVSSSLPKSSDG